MTMHHTPAPTPEGEMESTGLSHGGMLLFPIPGQPPTMRFS